jgi:hypothetical protein
MFNKAFLEALADHFRREGAKVIERVAKNQPAALASPEPQRAAQAATRTIPILTVNDDMVGQGLVASRWQHHRHQHSRD